MKQVPKATVERVLEAMGKIPNPCTARQICMALGRSMDVVRCALRMAEERGLALRAGRSRKGQVLWMLASPAHDQASGLGGQEAEMAPGEERPIEQIAEQQAAEQQAQPTSQEASQAIGQEAGGAREPMEARGAREASDPSLQAVLEAAEERVMQRVREYLEGEMGKLRASLEDAISRLERVEAGFSDFRERLRKWALKISGGSEVG